MSSGEAVACPSIGAARGVIHESEQELKMMRARLAAGVLFLTMTVVVDAQPAATQQTSADISGQASIALRAGASPSQERALKGTAGEAPGMMVYIDPKTGAFLHEPAPGYVPLPLSPELGNAWSTSDEGLVEVPIAVPGGGVKVDLKGRFQSPLVVVIDADGKVNMQHLMETPKPEYRK